MTSRKSARRINVTEVLDELKASVFLLAEYEKIKLPIASQKRIKTITAEELTIALGKCFVKPWIKQNDSFKISSYAEYVKWCDKNIYAKIERGHLQAYLESLPLTKRKPVREFLRSWEKLNKAFFTLLDKGSLNIISSAYEKQHFIRKGDALPNQPLLAESQDEIYNEFMDFSMRSPIVALGSTTKIAHRELLASKIKYENWILMLTLLAKSDFLEKSYAVNHRFLRTWLANHIAFDRAQLLVPITQERIRMKWTGPATALAEWLMLVRNHLVEYPHLTNRNLLKWLEQAIIYPGSKSALIAAISSLKRSGKFFHLKSGKSEFEFRINFSGRTAKSPKH
jgi:hypothetical protein